MGQSRISEIVQVAREFEDICVRTKCNNEEVTWKSPFQKESLYRGVSSSIYELIPGIYRQEFSECLEKNSELPKETIDYFIKEGALYAQGEKPLNMLEWLELAQHHKAPTALLDWTSSILVATFFACQPSHTSEMVEEKDGIVYAINHYKYISLCLDAGILFEQKDIECCKGKSYRQIAETQAADLYGFGGSGVSLLRSPLIFTPTFFSRRMEAQSSCFMFWGSCKEDLEAQINRITLPQEIEKYKIYEYVIGERELNATLAMNNTLLLKLIIKNEDKEEIIKDLDHMGVSERTLFPGLDGLGEYIRREIRRSK